MHNVLYPLPPIRLLSVHDVFLPETLNFQYFTLTSLQQIEVHIAALWYYKNSLNHDSLIIHPSPLQQFFVKGPVSEWHHIKLRKWLVGLEKRFGFYFKFLHSVFNQNPPDIIHAHFGNVACDYLSLIKKWNVPLVVSFLGYDIIEVPNHNPWYNRKYKELFQYASAIIVQGTFAKQKLMQLDCPENKIKLIPFGIDVSRFNPVRPRKIGQQLKLIQIATFTEKKGYIDTVNAFAIALQNNPNLTLTLMGEHHNQKLVDQIKHIITNKQLTHVIQIKTACPPSEIPKILDQYDVFIHPSHMGKNGDCEGAPLVISEAMACGLPIISTRHSDIPERVLHGQSGLLSDERDIDGIAHSISRFYNMEQLEYLKFSNAARTFAEQKLDFSITNKQLESLYADVIRNQNKN